MQRARSTLPNASPQQEAAHEADGSGEDPSLPEVPQAVQEQLGGSAHLSALQEPRQLAWGHDLDVGVRGQPSALSALTVRLHVGNEFCKLLVRHHREHVGGGISAMLRAENYFEILGENFFWERRERAVRGWKRGWGFPERGH